VNGDPDVQPGGPMTGAKLRLIAAWLDTYDNMAQEYLRASGVSEAIVESTVRGTEVQDDLRRWADELDQEAS
jgi:hypothetical protein